MDQFPLAARRRGVHIANVVPGPRPRTGFGGGDVEHCPLLWWYAVGADQATKLDIWRLIFQSQCVGNGKKKKVGLSSIVKTKFASKSSCAIPKCQSCELARAQQRSPKVKNV